MLPTKKPMNNPTQTAENKLDENYDNIQSNLTSDQRYAIKAYKEVLVHLGIDVLSNPTQPLLSPDRVLTDSSYLGLDEHQLMYYIGVLCGLRPYLCETMTDAKARAIYATVWRRFNEIGFRVTYRKDKLKDEVAKLEQKIEEKIKNTMLNKKIKRTETFGIKKHYTEDNLKDESSWRTYTWAKIEGEKIRKAELLSQYVMSIDNLIVALKERVRYQSPEKYQAKFGDQTNTLIP